MTPPLITEAITKALEAGAAAGLTTTAKTAIGDAYKGLKSLLHGKFGAGSEPAKAVESLEAKPDSKGRAETLTEELTSAQVASDPEIVASAEALLQLIRALPKGAQSTQIARGTGIAQASHGGNARATVYAPRKPRKNA